jgi:hypothetical protein
MPFRSIHERSRCRWRERSERTIVPPGEQACLPVHHLAGCAMGARFAAAAASACYLAHSGPAALRSTRRSPAWCSSSRLAAGFVHPAGRYHVIGVLQPLAASPALLVKPDDVAARVPESRRDLRRVGADRLHDLSSVGGHQLQRGRYAIHHHVHQQAGCRSGRPSQNPRPAHLADAIVKCGVTVAALPYIPAEDAPVKLRRRRRMASAGRALEGLRAAAAIAHAIARPHAGLGARMQRRRSGLLRFQHHGALRGVAGAGGDRVPGPGQAGVGREESALHQ